jgi:hypothetical protein
MLIPDHKEQKVQVCDDLLEWYETMISLTGSSLEMRPVYTITNQSQSSSFWSGDTRIRQKINSRLGHLLEVLCFILWGKRGVTLVDILE